MGLTYLLLLVTGPHIDGGGFFTLEQVHTLFQHPHSVLVGWTHYLAFDLFIGSWEVRDAQRHGISHFVVIPCLILTFLFGPIGLLLYLAIRLAKSRTLQLD